jgi:hypothetical protein
MLNSYFRIKCANKTQISPQNTNTILSTTVKKNNLIFEGKLDEENQSPIKYCIKSL